MTHLPQAKPRAKIGEVLSLGVEPDCLQADFVRNRKLRVSSDLLRVAMEQLGTRGVKSVRAVVDADNRAAAIFYHGLGWTLNRNVVSGWRSRIMEFLWAEDKPGL